MAFASFTIGIRSARSSRNNIASEYMKATGSEFLKLEMFPSIDDEQPTNWLMNGWLTD